MPNTFFLKTGLISAHAYNLTGYEASIPNISINIFGYYYRSIGPLSMMSCGAPVLALCLTELELKLEVPAPATT